MRRIRWMIVLPIVQMVVAAGCLFYEPYQYKARAQKDGVLNNVQYFWDHAPAPIGCFARALNYPAFLLSYPARDETWDLFGPGAVYVSLFDVVFVTLIGLFWTIAGRELDRGLRRMPHRERFARIRLAFGLAFAALTASDAIWLLKTGYRPERQIAIGGAVWTVLLLSYFVSRFLRERKAVTRDFES